MPPETHLKVNILLQRTAFDRAEATNLLPWKEHSGVQEAAAKGLAVPPLRTALALLFLSIPLGAGAQQSVKNSESQIEIYYARVAQHYMTSWSDPSLPVGVTRGTPPTAEAVSGEKTEDDDTASSTNLTQGLEANASLTEPAILYVVDRGDDGMEMILSAKTTIRPGNCVAVERLGRYTNLRTVNIAYCDSANQETVLNLQSVNEASARRCMTARKSHQARAPGQSPIRAAALAMLCDGS